MQRSSAFDHASQTNLAGIVSEKHSSRSCTPRLSRVVPKFRQFDRVLRDRIWPTMNDCLERCAADPEYFVQLIPHRSVDVCVGGLDPIPILRAAQYQCERCKAAFVCDAPGKRTRAKEHTQAFPFFRCR